MSNNQTLLSVSMTAICAGLFTSPISPLYGAFMATAGLTGVYTHMTTHSKFNRLWENLGLHKGTAVPLLLETRKNTVSTVYRFSLPTGLSSDAFERNKLAIEQHLNKSVTISYSNKNIIIEAFNAELPKLVEFETVSTKGAVAFPVGINRQGKIITIDLSENEPHLLICGETGSGKSVCLRSLITYLILTKNIDLHLIDYKMGAEFKVFEQCKKVKSFAKTISEANALLNKLSAEVDRRYDLFAQNNCVDIKDYNLKCKDKKLRYKVLVIDEFAEMAEEKGGIQRIQMLTAKARAAGIHCILATQRPSADVVNGRIKANCGSVIGLKTMNAINSRIVLDHDGLEELRGNGHAIAKHNGVENEVQCMFLSTKEAQELIKHTYIKKERIPTSDVVDFSCLEVILK